MTRYKRRASAMLDREDQKNALSRVMQNFSFGQMQEKRRTHDKGSDLFGTDDSIDEMRAVSVDDFARGQWREQNNGDGNRYVNDASNNHQNLQKHTNESTTNIVREGLIDCEHCRTGTSKCNAEILMLKKENSTLRENLVELSRENTNQREQVSNPFPIYFCRLLSPSQWFKFLDRLRD